MLSRLSQSKLGLPKNQLANQEAHETLKWLIQAKPLAKNPLFNRRTDEEHDLLLFALREQLQTLLIQIGQTLRKNELSTNQKERLRILNAYLLVFYPYTEPEPGTTLIYYHEFEENNWVAVEYRVKRLDLSPQSGFLAPLIKNEDRLYAYALETSAQTQPYLLFMGTPFPINHGSGLGMLHNFSLRYSAGEAHDWTEVNKWLARQTRIMVGGHSQGAVMAMITAGEHAHKISKAFCFSPSKLSSWTLKRLLPKWQQAEYKPDIHVYTPEGDHIFAFGKGFLSNTQVFKMSHGQRSIQLQNVHVPCGVGKKSFRLIDITDEQGGSRSLKEDLFTKTAHLASPLIFMARYLKLCNKLLIEKYGKRYLLPQALLFLSVNWLLHKTVVKKSSSFWALLAAYLLIQKWPKAARAFWAGIYILSVAIGLIYASASLLSQLSLGLVYRQKSGQFGSSAKILNILKMHCSSRIENEFPSIKISKLSEKLSAAGKLATLLYRFWSQKRKVSKADDLLLLNQMKNSMHRLNPK